MLQSVKVLILNTGLLLSLLFTSPTQHPHELCSLSYLSVPSYFHTFNQEIFETKFDLIPTGNTPKPIACSRLGLSLVCLKG